jgi:hypothetical protein
VQSPNLWLSDYTRPIFFLTQPCLEHDEINCTHFFTTFKTAREQYHSGLTPQSTNRTSSHDETISQGNSSKGHSKPEHLDLDIKSPPTPSRKAKEEADPNIRTDLDQHTIDLTKSLTVSEDIALE